MKKILICFTIAIPIVVCFGLWIGNKNETPKPQQTKTINSNKIQKSNNVKNKKDSNVSNEVSTTPNKTPQDNSQSDNNNSSSNEQPTSTENSNSSTTQKTSTPNDDGVARNAYGAPIDPARYVDPTDPSKGLRPNGETNPDFKATNPNATQWQDKYK